VVFGVDGGGTSGPVSNRVGEFTFGLVKGQ
jgi:hypothetical protein